jgi:L-fuculose-phosphate aldolase
VRVLTDEQIDVARTMGHTRLSEFQPRTHSSEELGLRRDMARMIQRALDHHLFTSTQGTISCALSDGSFLITPYNMDRQAIQEEELVLMRRSMKEAGKMPSRAVFLHELIYHHCPDIQAIICAQPPHLMAFTLTDAVRLETRLTDESYLLLKQLPLVPYGLNYSDPKKTMTLFNEQTPAVLLENDGIIVTGRNLKQAYDCFETAESTARTQLAILPDRSAHLLTEAQLAVLDQTNRQ